MNSKKARESKNLLIYLISIILLLLISIAVGYYLYLNLPRAPEKLEVNIEKVEFPEPVVSEAKQFYPNMKFNHNKISYNIDENCEDKKKEKILSAFSELGKNLNIIIFYPSLDGPDIEISCAQKNQESKEEIKEKHFVAGEGGAKEIIRTGRFNIITKGVILLYDNSKLKTIECEYPNVELHELMHVLGFDHVDNKQSLMFPFIDSCDQKLDYSLIEKLIQLYSQENFPDLHFENVNATKKGRYLDFNVVIKNSGSVNSDNITLTILDNEEVIEERDLGKFKFGSGISLETRNLKLNHLNPEKISFIIDRNNKIKELDENNNIAEVK